jgi:hypothetical protein
MELFAQQNEGEKELGDLANSAVDEQNTATQEV